MQGHRSAFLMLDLNACHPPNLQASMSGRGLPEPMSAPRDSESLFEMDFTTKNRPIVRLQSGHPDRAFSIK